MVLLKGFSKDGFKFFTHYSSRKGLEMEQNPNVALTFYWEPLQRSVRIEGIIEKLQEMESIKYFQSRPLISQIAAAASNQSKVVTSRDKLADKFEELKKIYSGASAIPKPSAWGGYMVHPHTIEFWQGQTSRLHDRIQFILVINNSHEKDELSVHKHCANDDNWVYQRLYP